MGDSINQYTPSFELRFQNPPIAHIINMRQKETVSQIEGQGHI